MIQHSIAWGWGWGWCREIWFRLLLLLLLFRTLREHRRTPVVWRCSIMWLLQYAIVVNAPFASRGGTLHWTLHQALRMYRRLCEVHPSQKQASQKQAIQKQANKGQASCNATAKNDQQALPQARFRAQMGPDGAPGGPDSPPVEASNVNRFYDR